MTRKLSASDPELRHFLNEYRALPSRTGEKLNWLKAHKLNYKTWMSYLQRVKKFDARNNGHLNNTKTEVTKTVTTEEILGALRGKRDVLDEVIHDIERMLKQ